MIKLAIHLEFSSTHSDFVTLESQYKKSLKKIATFLYQNPKLKICCSLSGFVLDFIEKKHPEFIRLMSELISRKQIEVLGGGLFEPIFPLISPQDRTGQIEFFTSRLRQNFGKRPHGICLFNSVWENSLVSCLQTSGFDYVLLDENIFPEHLREKQPFVFYELGKTLSGLAEISVTANSFSSFFENELKKIKDTQFICIKLTDSEFSEIISSENLNSVLTNLAESENIQNILPGTYVASSKEKYPVYINSSFKSATHNFSNIHELLLNDNSANLLYSRMVYVSNIVSSCKGDKMRKNSAREKLWQGQNARAFFSDKEDPSYKNESYKQLIKAEKLVREAAGNFKENITTFDWNFDGNSDYLCSMSNFSAVIIRKSAQICDFSVMINEKNYAGEQLSGKRRGFFLSKLLSDDDFSEYKRTFTDKNNNFSVSNENIYDEIKFEPFRKEIFLKSEENFSNLMVPILLKKKFIANSNGFTVQFIIKNDTPIFIRGKFAVESEFSKFSESINYYKTEVITSSEKKILANNESDSNQNVSFIQISDTENDVSFVFEPNEDCEVLSADFTHSHLLSLCWEIELSAGMEIEKSINFTVISSKRK